MPASPFCTDPDCSFANCRVLLEREVPYKRGDRTERLPCELRLCERCHLGFVHPVPADDVLAGFYTGDYTYYQAAGKQPGLEAASWKYRTARLRYLDRIAPSAVHRLASLLAILAERLTNKSITFTLGVPLALPKSSRILDYGYGTGSWLLSMRILGYSNLLGYDIAANAHRREELAACGVEVAPSGDLSGLAAASLDCVRLEHVFEHLADPLAVLRSLRRVLRPRGLLVMTFPAIYPWLGMKDLASSPFLDHLQMPLHLAHHSVESSSRLLRAAGFDGIVQRITARERFITLMARKPAGEGA